MSAPIVYVAETMNGAYGDCWFDATADEDIAAARGMMPHVRRSPAVLAADPMVMALLAAVIEEAAKLCDIYRDSSTPGGMQALADTLGRSIRTLRPDAAVSLARMLRDARNEGREQAAREADDHYAKGDMGNPGHWIRNLKEPTE